jgi:co-chaperonin GroES (HSP10)
MTNLDLSQAQILNQDTSVPATDDAKQRQIPDPATFHLLCIVPEAAEAFDSGLLKADQTKNYEEVLSPVLFVVKVGPDAFKDPKRFPSGPTCGPGEFVVVRPTAGTRLKIHGKEWRIITDDTVEAVVDDPRAIKRVN